MTTKRKQNFSLALPPKAAQAQAQKEDRMKDVIDLIQKQPISWSEIESHSNIGQGQYGTVFLVTHKPTNQQMAMKQIQPGLDDTGLKQIKTELDVLLRSQSPYIVKFFGSILREGFVYYCMEYMEFGSLDKLYKGGIEEKVMAKVAIAMIRGLKFLQDELRVIHRDVKPTNVLVNREGEIKLCDFGISGTLVHSVASTFTGCTFYMAPERIDTVNTASVYDVRSDVWSLGISLVEMGNGEPPFDINPSSVFALLDRIVKGPPPKLRNGFSPEATNFINRCLEKVATKRPTYGELLEDPWIKMHEEEVVDIAEYFERKRGNK